MRNDPDATPPPDARMPDVGVTMLRTRALNSLLGTHYTVEEVQEMDPLVFQVVAALKAGLTPPGS